MDIMTIISFLTALGNTMTHPETIVICGGTSIALEHGFRQSTEDIDCIECSAYTAKIAHIIARHYTLHIALSSHVCVTDSYSPKLLYYATTYGKFGNLTVKTICGVPLLCMKLKSYRQNSKDRIDCEFLLKEAITYGKTYDDVLTTFKDIYGNEALMPIAAETALRRAFNIQNVEEIQDKLSKFSKLINDGLLSINDIPVEYRNQILEYTLEKADD